MEHYRLINITADAMNSIGITDIRSHIMLLKCQPVERIQDRSGTGTFLFSKKPFAQSDINTVDSLCKTFEFEKIVTPAYTKDSVFAALVSSPQDRQRMKRTLPIDIESSTDDKPFFFQYMYFSDILRPDFWHEWDLGFNAKAVFILLALSVTMFLLSILCIAVPLKISSKKNRLTGSVTFFIFFASIGLGFMFIEISQIQRLNIFLGHPTYSLSAALFTLLLSSGIGSYFSGGNEGITRGSYLRFAALITLLLIFGLLTTSIITSFREYPTFIRVLVSALVLFPVGLFMGMAFPMGLKLASQKFTQITPWLWGINGVMSVLATVLSVIIAMNYGISASYWCGVTCYVIAGFSFLLMVRKTAELN
jgi:hypothetical protein